MTLTISPIYAGVIALIYVVLCARVIAYRRAHRLSLGDAGDASLLKRMRAQANCAEYAPLGLLLLLMAETQGAPALALHVLGLMLVLGRAAHGYGFSASPPRMALRFYGMVLTFLMILLSAFGLIVHAIL